METSVTIYKKCIRCNQEKPLWEFGVDKKKTLGVKDYCKECWEPHLKDIKNEKVENANYNKLLSENENKKILIEKLQNDIMSLTEKLDKEKIKFEELQKINVYEKSFILGKIKRAEVTNINKEKRKQFKKDYKDNIKKRTLIMDKKNAPLLKLAKKQIFKEKLDSDPVLKAKYSIRHLINCSFKKKGYPKNSRTQEILGCTFEEFKIYIENKFEPWMTWKNHGVYTGEKKLSWHLDHIIPLASAKTVDDVIRLNHYTNLQPLDSYINQVLKRDKIDWT